MTRFFWPTKLTSTPTGITYIGRALHWLALAIGFLVIAVSVPIVWYYLNHPIYEGSLGINSTVRHLALALPAAALIALLGRWLRYIFSGE